MGKGIFSEGTHTHSHTHTHTNREREKHIHPEPSVKPIQNAMTTFGIDVSEQHEIWRALMSILHLGNIEFKENDKGFAQIIDEQCECSDADVPFFQSFFKPSFKFSYLQFAAVCCIVKHHTALSAVYLSILPGK